MAIKQWTQPDGDHFRGLCQNEFWPVAESGAGGCNICVSPVQPVIPRCGCNPRTPIGVNRHLNYYVRITSVEKFIEYGLQSKGGFLDPGCWADDLLGNFQLQWNGSNFRCNADANAIGSVRVGAGPNYQLICLNAGDSLPADPLVPPDPVPRGANRISINFAGCNRATGLFAVELVTAKWVSTLRTRLPLPPLYFWGLGSGVVDNRYREFIPRVVLNSQNVAYCEDQRSRTPLLFSSFYLGNQLVSLGQSFEVGEISTHPF